MAPKPVFPAMFFSLEHLSMSNDLNEFYLEFPFNVILSRATETKLIFSSQFFHFFLQSVLNILSSSWFPPCPPNPVSFCHYFSIESLTDQSFFLLLLPLFKSRLQTPRQLYESLNWVSLIGLFSCVCLVFGFGP